MSISKRKILLVGLWVCISLMTFTASAAAQEPTPICFWSAQGPVCVQRPVKTLTDGLNLLTELLTGPTADERAQGLWSAIPEGTTLEKVDVSPDLTVLVRLDVPEDALQTLSHESFEGIVQQIGWTLEPLGWRDLRIYTRDPDSGEFVPLADFLPPIPAPRKATVLSGEEIFSQSTNLEGQPQGALSGKTVYISAGHGWEWNTNVNNWRTQRPPYPSSPYVDPIIEDHNNAEAVNQYLLQYLRNAGAQVWPVRERDMNEAEVVVDNDSPAPGTGYSETGIWATASPTGTGYAGTDYRYTTTVTGTPTATAVWTTTLPADDEYAVYVWYRPGSNRAPDAHYTIHHAGGETLVTVDQRHHGITWHYVGTYGFRAGEVATITLSNLSSQAGQIVIADAVRFGGGTFDDLTGVETIAPYPPDKPWWEVCAFYYVQRMGVAGDDLYGDVTARPIYARWEHAETGDDAVYVSWHTNGFIGYQETASGTESYVHNGETMSRTEGSLELQHAIHTELVHDIQIGWDSAWIDRGEKQKNLGELRLLWDNDASIRMPGALFEIAFHDHPDDTDALKEPHFNMLAARALYQGIVKYFEQRDGITLTELPEPPTHLAVQNASGGQVRVSWQPSPTDTVGLVGDAASGYRVYTSTDGLGWSNGAPVTGATAYTLTNLAPDSLLFIRVTATNNGGESLSTETLSVRTGDKAGVLLVNGFDRLNRTMTIPETDPVEGYNMRMFLDRMNRRDYVIQHGEVITYPFDSASNEAVTNGPSNLGDYALVDWILGEESTLDETLDATERTLIESFLGSGGALFLSGAEVGWHLDYQGGDPTFYNDVLRADYAGDDAETYQVAPVTGSIFEGLDAFRFDAPGMYDADYPDLITPTNGSTAALSYSGGLEGTAAVQYDGAVGCERLVYFGFPFETIWPDQRPAVMERVLDFLGLCLPVSVETKIATPADGSVHHTIPSFGGTASADGMGVLDRVEVQIQRLSDGRYWVTGTAGITGSAWITGTAWSTSTTWMTATGTASWTYPLPYLDNDDYRLYARAWTTGGEVDLSPDEVGFTYRARPVGIWLPLVLSGYRSARDPVLLNGGFETDEGWVLNQLAVYDTVRVHTGLRSARVGIPHGEPGSDAYSSVAQTFVVPSNGAVTLQLWVYPISEGDDSGDYHYVSLRDEADGYHTLDHWQSDAQEWEQRQYDLGSYLGQTVTLYIGARNDGDDDTAALYIDDVAIEVGP